MATLEYETNMDEAAMRWLFRRGDDHGNITLWTDDSHDDLWVCFVEEFQKEGVIADHQLPAATLVACAGKPILEVIDHPVTRERYGPGDVIERAFWDDEAQVSVFEVRRAA